MIEVLATISSPFRRYLESVDSERPNESLDDFISVALAVLGPNRPLRREDY